MKQLPYVTDSIFNKLLLCFLVLSNLFVQAQQPVGQFWMQNQSPDNLIWDNTAWNSQIDNGSGTLATASTQWTTKTGKANYKWITCKNAVFGGNPGVGAAGTVTLGGTLNNVKSISFYPAASGNFTLTGQSITTNCFSNLPIFVDTGLNPTVASVFSGTNGITKNGTGKLILTGSNTYSGITTIDSGTLQIDNGGTTGQLGGTNNVVNNANLEVNRGNSYIIANPISGSGSFTDNSAGTIILTGNNTYTGTTYINEGTIQIGNNGTTGHIVNSNKIVSTNNTNLTFQRTDNINFTVPMSGTGNMIQAGSGTTTVNVGNTFTGFTFLNAGNLTLDYQSVSPIMSPSSGLKFNGGTISFNNLGAKTQTFSKTIINSGAGKIVRGVNYTSGLLDLGDLSLISGIVDVSNVQSSASWIKCSTLNAGSLLGCSVTANNGTQVVGTDANGYLILGPSNNYSQGGNIVSDVTKATILTPTGIGGNISGASVSLAATGITDCMGILNAYTSTNGNSYIPLNIASGNTLRMAPIGGITNAAGTTLQITGGGTLTAGSVDNASGVLNINSTNNININGLIANNGTGVVNVVKAGSGTLSFNTAPTFTGSYYSASGITFLNPGVNFNTVSYAQFDNSTLFLPNATSTNYTYVYGNKLVLSNGGFINSNASGNGDGTCIINTPIEIVGNGNVIRYGMNHSYQQVLYMTKGLMGSGTVDIWDNWSSHPHGHYINGSMSAFTGTIRNPSYSTVPIDIESVDGWGTGATFIIEGSAGAVNYSGQWTNRNGQTKVAADINTPTNKLIVNGGNFYTSYNCTIGSLAGTGGQINIPSGKSFATGALNFDEIYSGIIAGASGVFIKNGTGNMLLAGNNTFTGGTVINGGSITAGHINAFGTGTITINAGATLNKNGYAITNTIVNNGGTVIP